MVCDNDINSSPDELLDMLPSTANFQGGINFTFALQLLQRQLENTWDVDRYGPLVNDHANSNGSGSSPVVIFLSNGECRVQDVTVQQLCQSASSRGYVYYSCTKKPDLSLPQGNHCHSIQSHLAVTEDPRCYAGWPLLPQKYGMPHPKIRLFQPGLIHVHSMMPLTQ
jgi:hypothetical protein